jgi:Tfp pilus assembly protein PilO
MNTSTRRIISVGAAVAILLAAVWYFALWSPQSHSFKAAHAAQAAAEQQVGQLDSQVSGLRVLVHQIPADRAKLLQLDGALPDSPSLDSALLQLQQAAAASGVAVSSVGPAAPAGVGGAPSATASAAATAGGPAITLTINATGSYAQLLTYLGQLANIPRALVVDHLTISGTGRVLTAAISARIFYAGSPTP